MTNDIMAENDFFAEVASTGYVWIALQGATALAFSDGEDKATLPVWQCKEMVEQFISNTGDSGSCHPVQVPLETFKVSWLSNTPMNIEELIINSDGLKTINLVLTKEEFVNRIWN